VLIKKAPTYGICGHLERKVGMLKELAQLLMIQKASSKFVGVYRIISMNGVW
jgi:hypothetical protein